MPHRNHITLSDKKMCFAERNLLPHQLRGARHYKKGFPILFNFGMLVRGASVLDSQRMQVELRLHLLQQRQVRLEQSDPDDVAGTLGIVSRLLDLDIENPLAAGIDAGCHDAGLACVRASSVRLNSLVRPG